MNNLVAWVTDKWVMNSSTKGHGFVVWYYVARYIHVEELHIRLRFYESTFQREHNPSISKADIEFRIRMGILGERGSYQLFEKEENGLKPIRSFTNEIDLLIHLDTAER
ncbi:hypothetical protein GO755_38550 [Spirosoma sp. HMF4905]|uniref:Uncharacterized protein n=1 Tax=Spirosoma arboris TaxID=2682092 RepID=A0A7K1SQ98_9BACT|nr:hypothetical protein [Spirosoma arboris]MVM35978.1 hypothetical protein [Spirosoma arboris]